MQLSEINKTFENMKVLIPDNNFNLIKKRKYNGHGGLRTPGLPVSDKISYRIVSYQPSALPGFQPKYL